MSGSFQLTHCITIFLTFGRGGPKALERSPVKLEACVYLSERFPRSLGSQKPAPIQPRKNPQSFENITPASVYLGARIELRTEAQPVGGEEGFWSPSFLGTRSRSAVRFGATAVPLAT